MPTTSRTGRALTVVAACAAFVAVSAVPAGAAVPLEPTSGGFVASPGGAGVAALGLAPGTTARLALPSAGVDVLSVRTAGATRGGSIAIGAVRVRFAAGVTGVTTVVVAPDSTGRVTLRHLSGSGVDLAIGVQASTPAGDVVGQGGFRAVAPVRVADPVGGGAAASTRRLPVAGVGGLPARGLTSVALQVAIPATGAPGTVGARSAAELAGGTEESGGAAQLVAPGTRAVVGTVFAAVDATGAAVLTGTGDGRALALATVDVVGFTLGRADAPGTLALTARDTVLDTAPGGAGNARPIPRGGSLRVDVPLPADPSSPAAAPFGVTGLLVAVQTAAATGTGALAVSGAGTATRADVAYGREAHAATVMVPLGADRTIRVTNLGGSAVGVVVTVIGSLQGDAPSAVASAPLRQTDVGDVVVDPGTGRVFVSGPTGGTVDVYGPDGRFLAPLRYQAEPRGLAVRDGVLYVARAADGTIGRFAVDTLADLGDLATGLPGVSRLARAGDRWWASSADTDAGNVLWRIDAAGTVQRFDGFGEEIAVAADAPGVLWATDRGLLGGLSRVEIGTGRPANAVYFPVDATSLALDPSGRTVYVAGNRFAAVDAASGRVRSASGTEGAVAVTATAAGLGLGSAAGSAWTARFAGPGFTPRLTVGAPTVPASSAGTVPHGVALGQGPGAGTMYVATAVRIGGDVGYRLASYRTRG